MMKFAMTAVLALALSACSVVKPKPPAQSQFLVPISNILLSVGIPARGAVATLVLVARNQGVETWQTGDNVSISLRDGVIVGTRGLGFDVMGAEVRPTLAALAGRQSGEYTLSRRYLTADNHPESIMATCTMARSGAQGQFVEDCRADVGKFRNEYWLDGSGRIVQSNQWIGPQVQHLKTSYAVAK